MHWIETQECATWSAEEKYLDPATYSLKANIREYINKSRENFDAYTDSIKGLVGGVYRK